MPRALKNLDITLGLAVIPVQLLTATSSQGVVFHLLYAKCGYRQQAFRPPNRNTSDLRQVVAPRVCWPPHRYPKRLERRAAFATVSHPGLVVTGS